MLMDSKDIYFGDWQRMFIGEVPASFFIELVIRGAVVYLILMLSMRAMGKRMSSQLSRTEMAALVSLAAAVGVPLMAPDRGILPAIVIAFVLVMVERLVARFAAKSELFERVAQGNVGLLVSDQVIRVNELKKVGISREQVFAQLRGKGVLNLGAVKRLYMEANGTFTLVKNEEPQPGLSVVPLIDRDLAAEFRQEEMSVCGYCGHPEKTVTNHVTICPVCEKKEWLNAVSDVD